MMGPGAAVAIGAGAAASAARAHRAIAPCSMPSLNPPPFPWLGFLGVVVLLYLSWVATCTLVGETPPEWSVLYSIFRRRSADERLIDQYR